MPVPVKKIFLSTLLSVLSLCIHAQESDRNFGGWAFVEVNHTFSKPQFYLTGYLECDNYYFTRLDCIYGRFAVGYKPLEWLKFGVNYVPTYEPGVWKHSIEADLMGTLASGNFKVSLRERYRYNFSSRSNELRSRLKVAYSIPDTKFTPYLAMEVFTWSSWLKTRHFVACTYDILPYMQFEFYYLYYSFADSPAQHALGFGFNFDF